jgi:hypothetical protein
LKHANVRNKARSAQPEHTTDICGISKGPIEKTALAGTFLFVSASD